MQALERFWWRREEPAGTWAWAWPLSLASLAFRAGAAWRARSIAPVRAKAKVISVGNIAVGGAGKTPVAMRLCELLRERGHNPALLSRGYGRTSREAVTRVCEGTGPLVDASIAGDEPLLIARRCPWLLVLVGADRVRLARAAEERGADVLVLDDGLQHRALARDLDVIVLDAKNPLGNGQRLPRGPLREGPEVFARVGSRGLLWLTNANGEHAPELPALLEMARAAGVRGPIESESVARPVCEMVGVPTFLLAGIARPQRFEETVRVLGADVRGRAFFADHHRFTAAELAGVRASARGAGARLIATTEKDAARLPQEALRGEPAIVPLPIDLLISRGQDALDESLAAALGAEMRDVRGGAR